MTTLALGGTRRAGGVGDLVYGEPGPRHVAGVARGERRATWTVLERTTWTALERATWRASGAGPQPRVSPFVTGG